ncbi:quinon protein alcohol dehydrogenase-like superfamily [Hyaloraphidium curvatum]|nr:quinon protein alcohol dehydrogenase-like superfamily [Hyaloraphidium curvatum]
MVTASLEGLCVGANAVTSGIAWGPDDLVAYAANCLIALWYPEATPQRGVVATLRGHSARVNCVAWLKRSGGPNLLVSGSADRTVRIWSVASTKQGVKWQCLQTLGNHPASVISIGVSTSATDGSEAVTFASCDSMGTLLFWKLTKSGEALCVHSEFQKGAYSLSLSVAHLGGENKAVVAAGSTDKKVHLWVEREDGKVVHQLAFGGHLDWVRGVAFYHGLDATYLASASQDRYIRVWKLVNTGNIVAGTQGDGNADDDLDAMEERQAPGAFAEEEPEEEMQGERFVDTKMMRLQVAAQSYAVSLETVLAAHDDWVLNVSWMRGSADEFPTLLSVSADKTLSLWMPDGGAERKWICLARLGTVGGASSYSFSGGIVDPSGKAIIASGHNGSLHIWRCLATAEGQDWVPAPGLTGHFRPVQSLAWHPSGSFVLTCGDDQTSRIFVPLHDVGPWVELSRPQVHGYDLSCCAVVRGSIYASGAEEKLVRIFEAPPLFEALCSALQDQQSSNARVSLSGSFGQTALPALGLSNKTVMDGSSGSISLSIPPLDEELQQQTLWPELNKLYGHGYEIAALTASQDGKVLVSASRATQPEHASLRFWDTMQWTELQAPLVLHSLTVTSMSFSPDNALLLTVSRDRSWALCERDADGRFRTVVHKGKAHSRIIWDARWSHDNVFFATASRDKTVKIWQTSLCRQSPDAEPVFTITAEVPVMSVDFAPCLTGKQRWVTLVLLAMLNLPDCLHRYILASGLEDGKIVLHGCAGDGLNWSCLLCIHESMLHSGMVKMLRFKPSDSRDENDVTSLRLASVGDDCSFRVYRLTL